MLILLPDSGWFEYPKTRNRVQLDDICLKPVSALNCYIALLTHMAVIDGVLGGSEKKFLERQCERFKISSDLENLEALEAQLNLEDLSAHYEMLVEENLHYSFLMDLVMMAVADGVVENREREFLQQIKNHVKIPNADFHNLVNLAKVTSGCDDLEHIDGNALNTLEHFFRWSGTSKIPLYLQTGFSLSESVDSQLKEIFEELEIGG